MSVIASTGAIGGSTFTIFIVSQADGYGLPDEADDVLWIVRAVGIVGSAAALVGRDPMPTTHSGVNPSFVGLRRIDFQPASLPNSTGKPSVALLHRVKDAVRRCLGRDGQI